MKKKKRYPSTMPCPCGSGKKYKDCCKNKDVKYILDDNTIIKKIPMRDELYEMLLREREEIKKLRNYMEDIH